MKMKFLRFLVCSLFVSLSNSSPLSTCLDQVTPFDCISQTIPNCIETISEVCDGRLNDCEGNVDESRSLCEDKRWLDLPCSDLDRCSGFRPGQCVDFNEVRCNGVYECIDRSDEDGCLKIKDELEKNRTKLEEEEIGTTVKMDSNATLTTPTPEGTKFLQKYYSKNFDYME